MIASGIELLVLSAIKATVVLTLAGLACARLRRRPANDRHRVWSVALAAVLALPVSTLLLPRVALPWLPAPDGEPRAAAAAVPAKVPTAEPPAVGTAETGALAPAGQGGGDFHPALWLGLLLAAGMVGRLAWLVVGLTRIRRLARHSVPWPDHPSARRRLASLARRAGCPRPVAVRCSDAVDAPITWGLRAPIVLLPDGARRWPRARLDACLLHEFAHVARRDWPLLLLARIALAVFWFHPLVAWAVRRQRIEAEHACDQRVLAAGIGALAYAEHLVTVARAARRPHPAAAAAMAPAGTLARRIRSILESSPRRPSMNRHHALLLAIAAVALTLTLAPTRLVRADADPYDDDRDRTVGPVDLALFQAADLGLVDDVRRLLDAGADPDRAIPGDGSALIAASGRGDLEVIEMLLDAGADPDLGVDGDGSALIAAAAAGELEAVRLLLARGADPDLGVGGDGNPLIAAAAHGRVEVLDHLLRVGADVDKVVPGDENALIQAAAHGRLAAARLLLDAGADPNLAVEVEHWRRGWEVRTPLSQARRHGHPDLVELLVAYGARD